MDSNEIVAYCGIVCSDCPAYTATQAGDQAALQRVLEQWRQEFNAPTMTIEYVACDGCLSGEQKCGYCAGCEIRACGVTRGVANCAHCPDYACDKLEGFFGMVPDARATLDRIRASR
jgi:hypothetical protein